MRENKALTKLKAGGEVVTGWLAIPSSVSAELMAKQGFDALTIDLQHGAVDYSDMLPMLQAISITDTTPMVRLPWNDPSIIGRVLDAGAYGVICPLINTGEEAEAFVKASRYFPKGGRSVGPLRASLYAGADYFKNANDTIVTMAMVESKQAIDNLEDILSVPGLDGIYVGPSDLGLSLGMAPKLDREEPEILKIYERLLSECGKRNIAVGLHNATGAYAKKMIGMGFKLTTILNDSGLMLQGAKAQIAAAR
jgi:4-hydroxy-2-oxoheptanedioate aldolase